MESDPAGPGGARAPAEEADRGSNTPVAQPDPNLSSSTYISAKSFDSFEFAVPPNPEMFSGFSLHPPLLQPDYSSRASGSLALDSAQNRVDISVIEFNDAEFLAPNPEIYSGSMHPPLLHPPRSPQPYTASGLFVPDSAQNRIDISLVESTSNQPVVPARADIMLLDESSSTFRGNINNRVDITCIPGPASSGLSDTPRLLAESESGHAARPHRGPESLSVVDAIRELSNQTRAHRREEQEARQHSIQMLSAALLEGVQGHTPPGPTGASGAQERPLRGLPRPRHRQNTTAQAAVRRAIHLLFFHGDETRLRAENTTARSLIQFRPRRHTVQQFNNLCSANSLPEALAACGPSRDSFTLDLKSTPTSSWNKAALVVFVDFYFGGRAPSIAEQDEVAKRFTIYFQTLRREYLRARRENNNLGAEEAGRTVNAQKQRRYRLWHRRVKISKQIPELRRHTAMLLHLGSNGMSDDEREEHNGVVSYRILPPDWRNRALMPFLRLFDDVSAICKEEDTMLDRRGNPVHRRILGGREAQKTPVRGLPSNAYDDDWKESLSEETILRLHEAPDYEFQHDRSLFRRFPGLRASRLSTH